MSDILWLSAKVKARRRRRREWEGGRAASKGGGARLKHLQCIDGLPAVFFLWGFKPHLRAGPRVTVPGRFATRGHRQVSRLTTTLLVALRSCTTGAGLMRPSMLLRALFALRVGVTSALQIADHKAHNSQARQWNRGRETEGSVQRW